MPPLSAAVLGVAERYPSIMRSVTEWVGRGVVSLVAAQRHAPHWLLTHLAHRTGARIPVALDVEGFQIVAPLNDYLHQEVVRSRSYEPETTAIFAKYLRPGMTVIEAGAHVGYFALYAARAVGPDGVVHAFEADPRTARWLRRNIRRNSIDNVRVNTVALSDHEGEAVFHVASDAGVSSLEVPKAEVYRSRPIRVPMTTLAQYVEQQGISRIDFLKMDIEGAELPALKPIESMLRRPDAPTMVIEFAPQRQQAFGHTVYDLAAFLRGCGYTLSRIGKTIDVMHDPVPGDAIYNVLCTK